MTKHFSAWRKSRHSEPNGDCVEVARVADRTIGVRDSKTLPDASILEFSQEEWRDFVSRIRNSTR